MTGNEDGNELPRPFEDFVKDRYQDQIKGLPIPFADYIVSQDDRRLGPTDTSFLHLNGEWEVIETSEGGYPVVVRTQSRDAAVATTLGTVAFTTFESALLGYSSEWGTFATAYTHNRENIHKEFNREIPAYADCLEPDNMEMLINSESHSAIAFIRKVNSYPSRNDGKYDMNSSAHLWYRQLGHVPWKALQQLQVDTYTTLINRYAVAAKSVDKRFNTTHPDDRDHKRNGDAEKGEVLRDMYRDMIDSDEN